MPQKLLNKIAVVTGGSSGIGLATAKRYVEEGAQVVITGRNQEALDQAVKEIGNNASAIQGDTANLEDIDRLFHIVKEQHGRVDILFVNAGVADFMTVQDVSEASFDYQMNVNVKGMFFTVQKALPLIPNGGSIILNSSITHMKGFGNMSVYAASKAAVRSFARTWASDLKERKIRVNTLSPGLTETPLYGKIGLSEEEIQTMSTNLIAQVPLARFASPEEIANTALFLASDEASYINGVDLAVDGGLAQI